MKKLFTLSLLCLLSLSIFANIQVSGVVVDEKGEPQIGVSIQVVGTTLGTITDVDGAFSISVPDDAKTLLFSAIGMKSQELPVKKVMHVVMTENVEVLQEVVATGYGNVTKGSFAGSAQAVDAETIEKKSPSEISKALTGEVAGVQVINTSGQPGTNATIRVRGIGSIYSSSAPLYVVDGIPYDGDVSAIDPSDIASTTILKDATATAMYGSRGANGVILITTKKGTSGEEGKIDVDVKYGCNTRLLPMYETINDPKEYVEMSWMGIYNSLKDAYSKETNLIKAVNNTLFSAKGIAPEYNLWDVPGTGLIDGNTGKFYDDVNYRNGYSNMTSWSQAMFRVGQKAEATVKISGGSEKTTYYTSVGYLKDEGYYIGSDYDRFTIRSNVDHQAKKWLKGGLNMSYTYSSMNAVGQDDNMNNGFAFVNEIAPVYPVYLYNEDGSIQVDPKTGGYAYDYGMREGSGRGYAAGINPAGALRLDRDQQIQHQVVGNTYLEFKLYEGLKFTVNAAVQYIGNTESEYTNAYYGDAAGIGRTAKSQANIFAFTANQLLEYNKTLGDHTIRFLAGHESQLVTQSVFYGGKNYVASTNGDAVLELGNAAQMSYLTSYKTSAAMDSYIATATYMYNERYGVTANYRADGSSRFAKGHRWGHFGSIGGSWNFTNESFIQDNADVKEWLKDGKLRLSWGVLGNQGSNNYNYTDKYTIDNVDGNVSIDWVSKGNPNLTWERSQQVDLGLELSINKYIDMELDYFWKSTDNLLFPCYVAPSLGYSSYWVNGGSLENQGFEMQFKFHAVDTRNVKLDIRLNGSHYANKVTALPDYISTDNEMIMNGSLTVGKGLYDWFMPTYLGVNPETGQATYRAYYDADLGAFGSRSAAGLRSTGSTGGNYISNLYEYRIQYPDADIQEWVVEGNESPYAANDFVGKTAMPALDGGFGFDLEVYGVTLDVTCSYRIGGYGYDNTYAGLMDSGQAGSTNWHKDMRGAWNERMSKEEKAAATAPRLSNGADTYANMASTRFLTSNSYLCLNNIRLGYNFPKKLLKWGENFKLNKLELYLTADNLAIATARKGYNPMVSYTGSSDSYQYTPLSTFMGGIKIQF